MQPRELIFEGRGGLRLRADAWGDPEAPAVLLLHGGGQTRHAWGGTAAALARDGRFAIALDQRGHGDSEWHGDGDYRLAAFAADLVRVLGRLPPSPALVGASLGGLAILLAAETPGFAPSAVVLVDVAPRLEPEGTRRITEFMTDRRDGFATLEEAADHIAAYTRERTRGRNLKGLLKVLRLGEDGRYRWHWDPLFITDRGPNEIVDRERLLDCARRIAAPALVVRGRQSDVLSPEGAAELVASFPDAKLVDVSGAGHMVAGDRNEVFTQAVVGFLRRCGQATPGARAG